MRLLDQAALITGAARGIAEGFAREGAKVAIADIDAEAAGKAAADVRERFGVETCSVGVDVKDRPSVRAMVEFVTQRLGRIDVLVNNAGISRVVPFLEMEETLWDATIDTNLKGTYLCCQAVLPGMLERGRGRIINISSQSGKHGNAQYAAYCASKFGIIGLTQSLAQEYAALGVTVNAICPGVVFTDLWRAPEMRDAYAKKHGLNSDDVEDYLKKRIPLRRLCTPEDVAKVAIFLASDESSYMTGQALNVTGGLEMA